MSFARILSKLAIYQPYNALNETYNNDGVPTNVASIGAVLDYILASMFPNAKPAVATENDLPTGVDTPNPGDVAPADNDYRIVLNYNATGQAAGYRFYKAEGQALSQWNLVQNFDSQDSILQQWELDASGLFVNENGMPGGQTIHGSTLPNEDLILSANSGDGTNDPSLQTGYIGLFSNTRPTADNVFNLGAAGERFASLFLAGNLSDGTNTVTVLEAKTAYDHSQIVTGNPHDLNYEDLTFRIGDIEFDGDVDPVTLDLSINGDQTVTLSVVNDSHDHTVSTITDFNDATWALLKTRLVDGGGITWTFNDGLKTATATVSIDTSSITDIASPLEDRILTGDIGGNNWRTSTGAVELTGDISGSGVYNSTTDKVSFATSVDNVAIQNIDRIAIDNLSVSIAADNPATVTQSAHGYETGRKIRLFNTASLNGEYTVTVIDPNSYSIPVDNSLGSIETGYAIPDAAQFLYDSTSDEWRVKLEYSQISHHEIANLTADDHLQYVNTNGRTNGTNNVVTGGELASGNLYLRSTSNATKGSILFEDNLVPATGAAYSGGWSGTDIGATGTRIRDIYMSGIVNNLRVEAVTSLPAATIQDKGRIVLLNGGDYYVNKNGVSYVKLIDSTHELVGSVLYKGTWNAATNTPDLTSITTKGNYYVVSADGATDLDGETDWKVTDIAIHNGTTWEKIDNTDSVTSVAGRIGNIVLDSDDIAEAGKLFFTDARAKAAIIYEQETPSGLVNGVNAGFTLAQTPHSNGSVQLFVNGLIQRQGVDYTIVGTAITMTSAPQVGQDIYAYYTRG